VDVICTSRHAPRRVARARIRRDRRAPGQRRY